NNVDKYLTLDFNCTDFKMISMNILMNASKYTNSGTIKVYNKGNKIFFENSGKEIDLLQKDSIFEPFFTIDKSKNRKKSGFGLGLSIVQNLSKNNGYTCSLLNSDKQKTTFVLEPLSEE
ncbi:MAG TPA: ATP-binding protein, partial [Nitratifractor sp.]|nr:ATP-binding protein [Nitratifractor sp.]